METTSKPKIPPKVWMIVGVAAVVVTIAVGIFAASRPKATTMHLLRTEGTVSVSDGEDKEVKLRENLGLYGGYQVGTQNSSYAWIDLDEVKLTKMDQGSEIQIHKEDKHLEIEVKSGSLFFNVTQPLAEDETLNIRTSSMIVGIRGTCGWVVSDGEKGAQVFILEGQVEAETTDTGEAVTVSAGEMAQVTVTEDGETQIEVHAFAEEYVAPFVLAELEEDTDLSAAVLSASGLDVLDPPDPAERLQAEYHEIIASHPILDTGASTSYTSGGVAYASEGLSEAVTLDLNGDGTEELMLVIQQGDFLYSGPITRLEVYGSKMGKAVLYDAIDFNEADYMGGEYAYPPNQFWLLDSNGKPYIYLFHGTQATANEHLFTLENDALTLIERTYDWSEGLEQKYNCVYLADVAYTVQELPAIPADVQRKSELQRNLDSREYDEYPIYARLADTDQDSEDEMLVLSLYEFCICDWDGTQIQSTVLERNMSYAKLIDMNQDGKEELLLVSTTDDGVFSVAVYALDDMGGLKKEAINLESVFPQGLNIYQEKTTGNTYLGGLVSEGSGGQISEFVSLTNRVYAEYEHFNPNWVYDLDNLTSAERAKVDAGLAESQRQWDEYEAQVNRFELIERINIDSFEWQEALAYTVDEVRQQLMTR